MSYATRTKDSAGDPGRHLDQNQSVDNEEWLYGQIVAAAPAEHVVKGFAQRTDLADNVATEIFRITTTNETGDADAGVYAVFVKWIAVFADDETAGVSIAAGTFYTVHVLNEDGSVGGVDDSGPVTQTMTEYHTAIAQREISGVTISFAEDTEFNTIVKFAVNTAGTETGTRRVYADIEIMYDVHLTAPEIVSYE